MKRFLIIIMACIAALSLAGCGEKAPTADELMANAKAASAAAYQDFDLEMAVKADPPSAQDGDPANAGSVSAKGRVEVSGSVVHMEGFTMTVDMSGLSMDMTMDVWADQQAGTGYVKTAMFGQDTGWVKSGTDGTTVDASGMAGTLDQFLGGIKDVSLQEHKKGEDWTVTGTMSLADLDMGVPMSEGDMGNMAGSVALRFDESSRQLKSMTLEASGDGMSFHATVSMRSVSDQAALAIPQEVIDAAVEDDSEGFTLEGGGLDEGFSTGGGADEGGGTAGAYAPQDGMFDRGGFDFGNGG